ncbi:MAG: hypothetical protein U5K99_10365 [Anaerolineales bacterium]|nr:hypothetical protein [Anaerolineales bacterium]
MDKVGIEVKPRPWLEWILWAVWFLAEIFFLQNAIASGKELQSTAATIFWVIFAVLLIAGIVVWIIRSPEKQD